MDEVHGGGAPVFRVKETPLEPNDFVSFEPHKKTGNMVKVGADMMLVMLAISLYLHSHSFMCVLSSAHPSISF